MFKALNENPLVAKEMQSSAFLTNVPKEDRVDGWGNPYCIFAESKQMVFLSSGGNGALDCAKLRQSAQQAAAKSTDARLTKAGELLAAVYTRVKSGASRG
jgi:hypothetical protein